MKKPLLILLLLTASASLAVYRSAQSQTPFRHITTAHQAGPVGLRDPLGSISPDGVWLAYISNRHLFLHRIDKSTTTELMPADNNKTALTWFPDSRHLAVAETAFASAPKWFRYDVTTGTREALAVAPQVESPATSLASVYDKIWGPAVFSSDRRSIYYSVANERGTLDLWTRNLLTGVKSQVTHFDRDTYDPSVTSSGDILFKSQVFSAVLGTAPVTGGPSQTLTSFQSETPTWSPDGKNVAFTFGSWRRVIDDARYPDISQDLGIILSGQSIIAAKPARIFQASPSEDQSMVWSPNGKWVVFHSHRNQTDDLYLQIANGSKPPVRITTGGIETGWPRWSPDGKWIAYGSYPGAYTSTRGKLYVLGVDQNTGAITKKAAPIEIDEQQGTAGEPNWLPDSENLVFDISGQTPGKKSLAQVARTGGKYRKIVDYSSDQLFSGISASPDGKWAAYVANAPDGTYQIFRVPLAGGTPEQVTKDPSHKTQPSFSPDGSKLAFTIWRYDVEFWLLHPEQ